MAKQSNIQLCPAQKQAFDSALAGVQLGSILRVWGGTGRGKTTILRELHRQVGGAFLNMKEFVEASATKHPMALEETLYQLIMDALKANPLVIVDDVHLLDLFSAGCHFYPRSGFFNSTMMGLCTYALEAKKKLVFAPKLNGHQLKAACRWLVNYKELTTDAFIEYLRSQRLASNVDLGEVQAVDLKDLKGVDDVLRNLEINIVLPLQNDELANRFRLRSKRGVLLYGPPGTGKTTVGRALAHRLKGKFFLIDGTFIAGTDGFYNRINQVFEAAKDNAPSVIFIDDADAIFEDGEERGLYRYLLTMIDGLESESAGRVCVMMTAMDVAHLPPALVRSGRVELWLEMKLPDAQARADILSKHLANLPEEIRQADVPQLIAATQGFTGADLKRMVEDGKAIYAYDRARDVESMPTTQYFLRAIEAVKENKQHYAAAEAQALMHPKSPVSGFFRSFVTSEAFKISGDEE